MIKLTYNCPKKWDDMQADKNGRFCEDCKKVVKDYTKYSVSKLNSLSNKEFESTECGNFKITQLEKPFGDWRDNLISSYQTLSFKSSKSNLYKKVVSVLLLVALFFCGCRTRHVRGKYVAAPSKFDAKKEVINTIGND